ncbi:albusnodin family lasso peptide [Actinomadura formosensis]|uniref:albusnodin family lasso peptide n=1 Tax=Actinomadura formosensis TaxID=60706 RepID=UPI000AD80ADB|nr:albusnodin family lasso peptide [Actinomadura formosensis]
MAVTGTLKNCWTNVTAEPSDQDQESDAPILLVHLGETSALTLGQGKGSSEDKRRAYN